MQQAIFVIPRHPEKIAVQSARVLPPPVYPVYGRDFIADFVARGTDTEFEPLMFRIIENARLRPKSATTLVKNSTIRPECRQIKMKGKSYPQKFRILRPLTACRVVLPNL